MTKDKDTIFPETGKLTLGARLIAAAVFGSIAVGIAVLWAAENDYIDLSYLFGVCGFKQRFSLPCPGCGWTHAAQMFVTGHFVQAFRIQPAAAVFCLLFSLIAVFALHCAVFGINSRLLKRVFCSGGITILLIAACVIILAGWMVNLIRTILES